MTRVLADSVVRSGPFDPPAVVARLSASGLLGEHVAYERAGCWHIGARPVGRVRVDARSVHAEFADARTDAPFTGWGAVAAALARCPEPGWTALGWASFELARPAAAAGDVLHLMIPGLSIRLTPDEVTVRGPGADDVLDVIGAAAPPAVPVPAPVRIDGDRYRDGVATAVARIRSGALEKVILSRAVPVEGAVDLAATYALGRAHNTPARSFLLDLGGWEAAGFSPESLVEVEPSGRISTQPLAGTCARTADAAADAARRNLLLADPKEVYEHATSVRLAFTELASVAAPGSTRIEEFLAVKQRGSVQHLGSRVSAQLAAGRGPWDAFGAVFPAVTASGIPKAPAVALIDELEDGPRGLYAGAVISADAGGALDAALVLRAIYRHRGRTWLRAGAGIVGASTPEREYEETCEKLASVAPYVVLGG